MTDPEIRSGLDRIIENLRAEVAKYAKAAGKYEALADAYWAQLNRVKADRDALQARVNQLERCANPVCQLCNPDA